MAVQDSKRRVALITGVTGQDGAYLAEYLLGLGYTVLRASNGEEGLRVAREVKGAPVSLVVTDVVMPRMGGRIMAEWLKATDPNVKILYTSGYTEEAISQHGIQGPDMALLPKPYTPATLAHKVRELLDAPTA